MFRAFYLPPNAIHSLDYGNLWPFFGHKTEKYKANQLSITHIKLAAFTITLASIFRSPFQALHHKW